MEKNDKSNLAYSSIFSQYPGALINLTSLICQFDQKIIIVKYCGRYTIRRYQYPQYGLTIWADLPLFWRKSHLHMVRLLAVSLSQATIKWTYFHSVTYRYHTPRSIKCHFHLSLIHERRQSLRLSVSAWLFFVWKTTSYLRHYGLWISIGDWVIPNTI